MKASRAGRGSWSGCLQWTLAVPLLALLSPLAVAVRAWRRWRRGSAIVLVRRQGAAASTGAGPIARLELSVDVPHGRERDVARRLTDAVVRVAEALRRGDDAYHLVYRQPERAETTLLPVGAQVQELGERLALALAQIDLDGRTVLWLALPRKLSPASLLDPFAYDPEAAGEPERAALQAGVHWALASARGAAAASTLYRAVLWVPESAAGRVGDILDRLERGLRAGE